MSVNIPRDKTTVAVPLEAFFGPDKIAVPEGTVVSSSLDGAATAAIDAAGLVTVTRQTPTAVTVTITATSYAGIPFQFSTQMDVTLEAVEQPPVRADRLAFNEALAVNG